MSVKILLRAKSGPSIGSDHVNRARSVAQALFERGVWPHIAVDDSTTLARLRSEGFDASLASGEHSLSHEHFDAACFDGFPDWSETIAALDRSGTRTVLVENRTAARAHAWRVLYPALHYHLDSWDEVHPERVLAGSSWVPFGREFLEQRAAGVREFDLLVTFGGADPHCLTERTLALLDPEVGRVLATVGPHMLRRREAIERAGEHLHGLQIVAGSTSLAPWMAASRVALTSVGTGLNELALLQTPALVLANHAHDREALAFYAEHGPHWPVGIALELEDHELQASLRTGIARMRDSRVSPLAGSGEGARRIARLLVDGVSS
jgi:spore coat polysaccharide biosynthesis predicted glycosyltransferase SpsG